MEKRTTEKKMAAYSYSYRGAEEEKCPPVYAYQYNSCAEEDERIEFKLRCPTIKSFRWCLKLYCLVLGGLGTLLSFIWVCFHLYVLSQTEVQDLRIMRYLDIGLGLLLFSSTISLIYAGYAESRGWLVVFTTGSLSVLILYWSWAGYNKYVSTDNPETNEQMEEICLILTIVYSALLLPLILYYRAIDSTSRRSCDNCHNCQQSKQTYRPKPYQEA